jgi:hypothetical protein
MGGEEFLKYGAFGVLALIVVVALVPVLKAMVSEIKDSRLERQQMRADYQDFVCNHAKGMMSALGEVRDGLRGVCDRLNGGASKR